MGCSMPGFPVPHHLPELAQVHGHCTRPKRTLELWFRVRQSHWHLGNRWFFHDNEAPVLDASSIIRPALGASGAEGNDWGSCYSCTVLQEVLDLIKWIKPFRFYSEEGDVIIRNLPHDCMTRPFLQEICTTPGDGGPRPTGKKGKRQRGKQALVWGNGVPQGLRGKLVSR